MIFKLLRVLILTSSVLLINAITSEDPTKQWSTSWIITYHPKMQTILILKPYLHDCIIQALDKYLPSTPIYSLLPRRCSDASTCCSGRERMMWWRFTNEEGLGWYSFVRLDILLSLCIIDKLDYSSNSTRSRLAQGIHDTDRGLLGVTIKQFICGLLSYTNI